MDIDPDIANWVMEFLLRQPLEDRILKSLLRVLPLRDTDLNLKKLILLKELESNVSTRSISQETLASLEQLTEIGFQKGSGNVSDVMRQAYCAVAVECSVKAVANQDVGDEPSRVRYYDVVRRVWKGRMERMKEAMATSGGLGSDELWAWKKEIEDGAWDDNVRDTVLKKSLEVNAVDAIKNYLRYEREDMGPSFLELVAARMNSDEFLKGVMLGAGTVDRIADKQKCCPDARLIEDDRIGNNEIQKEKVHLRNKVVARRHSIGSTFGSSRRAKLVDSNEITPGSSRCNYNLPSSEEVDRVKESLVSSSLELQAVVKDPLPEALKLAKAISNEVREHKHCNSEQENCAEANIVDGAGVDQPIGCDERQENGCHDPVNENCNASNMRRPGLMERNASAHTYEWNDSIDRSQDSQADSPGRLLLPSPVVLNVSPLRRYQNICLKRRRQPKKWTSMEEDALRDGVQKYGKGNWKFILAAYRSKFEDRTEGDLKDKWRNMTRG